MTSTSRSRHSWSEDDDLVGLFLYRFGDDDLPLSQEAIANRLGMSEASMIMKRQNYASLDKKQGLSNASAQSRRIHESYKRTPKNELRKLVLRVIEAKQEK